MEDRKPMANPSQRRFLFGPFILDARSIELRRDGEIVPLRPKCFDLLVYFAENPGRLITKDELLQSIWSDVIVNEGTINRTVTSVRSSLSDDADNPRYIETVSRRGYKFIATVETQSEVAAIPESADFALIYNEKEFPLRDGVHLVGRAADAAVPLYGSAISRHHARIVVTGPSVTIEDLESRNGTFVNGVAVRGVVALHSGDEISIGKERLVLWSRTSATAPETS
jgi:DNA-binding winged helix-turn-helix (wHTH) protein